MESSASPVIRSLQMTVQSVLSFEALRGVLKRPDVCLSAASTPSLKGAFNTPSLQSVSFSENAPASL